MSRDTSVAFGKLEWLPIVVLSSWRRAGRNVMNLLFGPIGWHEASKFKKYAPRPVGFV